ncbi:hypothetical protein EVJ32_10940 [Exiguobacterium sp. SH5S4]|uniref:hypothetical protein n=1 Tax=Exiguobacterium sp. SH5S4 TaxID=2510961 RepID=UPI00103A6456|nr:hypothetical protein [Exiguobacterium sp. SH5S4]TCI25307.1 hypothetical protein EVJ32_10940 [Exiguobacterium sp. SH5S4]
MIKQYKYMKIMNFPEELFYMERMVGYNKEPKILMEIERDSTSNNSIRATFRTVVQMVSHCDSSKTVNSKVTVSLVTVLGDDSKEIGERCYINPSSSYRKLGFKLRKEIEEHLNTHIDSVIKVLSQNHLSEWLSHHEKVV